MMNGDKKFEGTNPFEITKRWLAEAVETEPNDPNAISLATVDADGMPNVRVVLLKDIDEDSFVIYTNYGSAKAVEALGNGSVAFVMHWKSLRRQVRVRGTVVKEDGPQADAYFASRHPQSRLGAWASRQSQPLADRQTLMNRLDKVRGDKGETAERPSFWGGLRISPVEFEFWADGEARLHDRFRWTISSEKNAWSVVRLNP